MTGSSRGAQGASVLESWTVSLTSPVVSLAQAVGGGVRGAVDGARNLVTAHGRSEQLEIEVRQLRSEVRRHREASMENSRLRRLLSMQEDQQPGAIAASVVTTTQTDQAKLIVVDRGSRDGVRSELPVVALGGAVGRVVAVYDRHAKVRLITDPNSGVAGIIQRNRAQGVVLGQGERPLELLYVPRFTEVMSGDRVVTSALDGIFPRGWGIGRVVSTNESPSGTRVIYLQPDLDFASLEEVLILSESSGGGVLEAPEPADGS